MKFAVVASFFTALVAATPKPSGTIVDLSDLIQAAGLEKRGDCPSQQTCVGHRCVMLVCEPIPYSTTCITYKYGDC